MLRAIIIDDEQDGINVLSTMIADFCKEVNIVDTCTRGKDGVKAILQHNPDLVFMDIDMPDMNGFQVLDCVKNQKLKVIFVTAYNEYAIRAFKYSAVDYILKPPSPHDLIEAVQKSIALNHGNSTMQYDLLLNHLKHEDQTPEVIALPMSDGLQVIQVSEIMYCRADRNYTHVHLADKTKILVSKQLKEFENMLAQHGFYRIHHSALINLKYISKYVRGEGGYVIMKDDSSIELSRQKKEEFLKLINKV